MNREELKEGMIVTYIPSHKTDKESGRVKSWNDTYVFVHYFKSGTSKATKVEDLVEGEQSDNDYVYTV